MSDQQIRFRVVMDDAGVSNAGARTEASLRGIERAGMQASASVKAFGQQSKLSANDMRLLSMQTSDIFVSLGSGQNPFTVLLQQGAQLRDQFGSTRGVFAAYASTLSVTRVAVGGLAGALAVLGLGAYQGYDAAMQLQRGLVASGNAAGVTRGQVDALAESLATTADAPIGAVRGALAGLATSGAFVGQNLELAGRAAIGMAKLTGQSAEEVAKDLTKMSGGVTEYVANANKQYNFLTIEVYKQIKALEAQGRTQEATTLALKELAATAEARVPQAMGSLERAMLAVSKTASSMWDFILGIGRPVTVESQLEKVSRTLADFERSMPNFNGGSERRALVEAEVDRLKTLQASLQEDVRRNQRKVESDAREASKVQAAIKADQSGKEKADMAAKLSAELALQAANSAQATAIAQAGLAERRRVMDREYTLGLSTQRDYHDQVKMMEMGRANLAVEAAESAIAIERKRGASTPAEKINRDAAVVQAQTKLNQAIAERNQLAFDISEGKFLPKARDVLETPQADFRRQEILAGQALEASWAERIGTSRQGVRELLATNAEMNIGMIRDDRLRGMAQIRQEEDTLRKKLDLAVLNIEERKAAEDALANWRLAREQQLTEQLKPQWQRNAELWADTTRDMADRYNEFMDGFVDSGRDAFTRWVETGKLSTQTLTQFIRAQFAKMVYERFLASYVQQAGNWLFNTLMGAGASSGGSGNPDDVPTRGGRAAGGSVPPMSAWVVGEKGPEVLMMGRSGGVIVPNHAMAQAGAQQPLQITQHISAPAGQDQSSMYQFAAVVKQSTMDAIAEARRRGDRRYV